VALHFTWRPHPAPVADLVERLESALTHLDPRPHWGKVFTMEAATIAQRFPKHADFVSLVERLDPRGAFRTPWLDRHLLG
jgi:xylitol oxidase